VAICNGLKTFGNEVVHAKLKDENAAIVSVAQKMTAGTDARVCYRWIVKEQLIQPEVI